MRRFEGGQLVGEIDPPPTNSLREWIDSEIAVAAKFRASAERMHNWTTATGLQGRIDALKDVLRQMDLRTPAEEPQKTSEEL